MLHGPVGDGKKNVKFPTNPSVSDADVLVDVIRLQAIDWKAEGLNSGPVSDAAYQVSSLGTMKDGVVMQKCHSSNLSR